jgi:hypothetical protein
MISTVPALLLASRPLFRVTSRRPTVVYSGGVVPSENPEPTLWNPKMAKHQASKKICLPQAGRMRNTGSNFFMTLLNSTLQWSASRRKGIIRFSMSLKTRMACPSPQGAGFEARNTYI